jgi:Ras GTPase-activating protein 1
LCPALLAPDQFNMYEVGYPNVVRKSSSVTRRFILIAKVIQNLANGIEFGGKEEYMGPLGVLLAPYASKMSNFIDAFVVR